MLRVLSIFLLLAVAVLTSSARDDDDDDGKRGKRTVTTKSSSRGSAFRAATPTGGLLGKTDGGTRRFNNEPAEDQVHVPNWKEAAIIGPDLEEARKIQLETKRKRADLFWLTHLKRWDVSPNAPNNDGHTCLHFAAWNGYEETTRYLLSIQADPAVKTPAGLTAADLAERRGHEHILKLLPAK